MISAQTLRVCREGKRVSTHRVVARGHAFPDHALAQLESGHMDYMCQVSSSELGLIDPCLDLCVDVVECALERGIDGAEVWKRGGEAWAQEAEGWAAIPICDSRY
jgi:hypothetical protein